MSAEDQFNPTQETSPSQEEVAFDPEASADHLKAEIAIEASAILSDENVSPYDQGRVDTLVAESGETNLDLPDFPTTTIEVGGKVREVLVTGKKIPTMPDGTFDKSAKLTFDNLVAIRETKYHPVQDERGEWYIPSPYEATKDSSDPSKIDARFTSHFSVNHQVVENQGRSSIDNGFLILAPLQGVIDRNLTNPANLDIDDMFFRTDRIYLPPGTQIIDIKDGQTEVSPEDMMQVMGFSPFKVDRYGRAGEAEDLIDDFATEQGIEMYGLHMKSPDGAIEGSLYTIFGEGTLMTPQLEVLISRYNQDGFEYYQPIIVDGLKKYRERIANNDANKDQVEKIDSFLSEFVS